MKISIAILKELEEMLKRARISDLNLPITYIINQVQPKINVMIKRRKEIEEMLIIAQNSCLIKTKDESDDRIGA